MRTVAAVVLVLSCLLGWDGAAAHELRPSVLTLTETVTGHFDVSIRVSRLGSAPVRLAPVFPPACRPAGAALTAADFGIEVRRFAVACDGAIGGETIAIDGLAGC